jgi:hypothetical protein
MLKTESAIIEVFIRNSVHTSMVDKETFTVCKDFVTVSVILAKYSIKIYQNEIRHQKTSLS